MNQRAVNLHMLEDVFGWIVVLVGGLLMKFTDIKIIDSLMSIGLALFILVHAFKNLKEILDLFLEKTPNNIDIDDLKNHLLKINGIDDVHHIHVWSIDGVNNYATLHVVSSLDDIKIKKEIRKEMLELGIVHTTIEIEKDGECDSCECNVFDNNKIYHHHHHH